MNRTAARVLLTATSDRVSAAAVFLTDSALLARSKGPRDASCDVRQTSVCIVGGGPGGAMLALLLARRGVDVVLLEAHQDFEREFRGDGIQPSTLSTLEQIGLIEGFLKLPHARVSQMAVRTPKGIASIYDLTKLSPRYPYVLSMPQARFLEFITAEAAQYPSFRLIFRARVDSLIEENDAIRGVEYHKDGRRHQVHAQLTVGADGRFSKVRQLGGFQLKPSFAHAEYLLWCRLPSVATDAPANSGLYAAPGSLVAVLYRGSEWQLGISFPKGGYRKLRAQGLGALQRLIGEQVPWLADRTNRLADWTQCSVLTIASSRVGRWYRPGLLLIGDAAHVMGPQGAQGINVAIGDAVTAANVLIPRLHAGNVRTRDLATIQRHREWRVRLVQWLQATLAEQTAAAVGDGRRMSLTARVFAGVPVLRDLRGRVFVFGGPWPKPVVSGEAAGSAREHGQTRLASLRQWWVGLGRLRRSGSSDGARGQAYDACR